MFWVGLATLMMAVTGVGDDTRPFRDWLDSIREAVKEDVKDTARRDKALAVVDKTEQAFREQRKGLDGVAQCFEKLDRSYQVTAEQYDKCMLPLETVYAAGVEALIGVRHEFRAAVTEEERLTLRARVEAK